MPRKPHSSPRVVCVALATFVASGLLPSFGQETDSGLERRVSGRLDVRVQPVDGSRQDASAGKVKTQGLDLSAVISAAYEDNINLADRNPEHDLVIRVAPTVAYVRGAADDVEGGYIRVAYRPTGVVYTEHNDSNRVDQDASWDVGVRGQKFAAAYGGRVQKLGDPTPDTGRQTDRVMLEQVARVAWVPREKLALELAAGQSSTDYRDRRFADSHGAYGEVALRYAYSPKTRLGIIYRGGTFDVDGANNQNIQRGTVRLEWKPREKISFDVEAGGEHRAFDAGSATKPVIEAKATWQPRDGTGIFLSGHQRTEASAFYPGQDYDLTGISAGIEQRMGQKWSGRLEGGFEKASYSRVSGNGPANRKDQIVFIRPSIRCQLTDDIDIEWFYRYECNDSNQPGFGYKSNTAGIQFGYKF